MKWWDRIWQSFQSKPQTLDIRKAKVTMYLDDGSEVTFTTIGRATYIMSDWYVCTADRVAEMRMENEWIVTDDGMRYSRRVVRMFKIESESNLIEVKC